MDKILMAVGGATVAAAIASGTYTVMHNRPDDSHMPGAVGLGGLAAVVGGGWAVVKGFGAAFQSDTEAGARMLRTAGISGTAAALGVGILAGGLAGWGINAGVNALRDRT